LATETAPTHETIAVRNPPWGIVGWVDTAPGIYKTCEALRDAGYKKFDAHTPFPVHGLENAMGLKPSKLPWLVLGCAFTGATAALTMMIWMNVIDYPMNIGGKPFMTLPSYVPITFELTILFSALGSFFGMWGMNRLPKYFDPVMQHPTFYRASDDRFFVSVEAADPNFDLAKTRSFLEGLGVQELAEVAP
jgi:hypothetical protein